MTGLTVSGIVSGLDTSSIIDKLVQVEGNSQALLKNQQTTQKSVVSAYTDLLSGIGTLATQVAKLANTSSWSTTSATSSSASVTTTASGNIASSLTFDVTSLATAHTLISSDTVSAKSAVVASSGTLTLTDANGEDTEIDVGNGTLSEVVAAINGAKAGISATAVQTSPGQYRLQVTATGTGDASQFTLTGIDGFTAMNVLTPGADAEITVGSGINAYTVNSTTNTFTNVAEGISFTVSKLEDDVTVSSTVDPSAVTDQISAIVTNVNNLLSKIATDTAWDSTTKSGGALLGSSSVRSLQNGILSIVSGLGAPGMQVTAGGQLTFDAAAFKKAFTSDPTAVMNKYGASSSFEEAGGVSASARYTNATSATRAGNYDITVSQNAESELWHLVPPGTGVVGRLLSLTRGSTTVNYTVQAGETVAVAAANFNAKLAQAGVGVSASTDNSGNIVLTAANAGAAGAFEASIDGGGTATQITAGTDIEGTIDGIQAVGVGNVLSLGSTADSDAKGLSVEVTASDDDVATLGGYIGTLTYNPGLAQQLSTLFTQMSDSSTGTLVTAQAQASAQVTNLQTQIDSWTYRLESYRTMLTTKFSAMESALASLKTQSSAMSSFFSTSSSSSSSSSSS
jgi:flagellar hook-associated protein 2